ncbi:hypothetical protein [Cardinium endosymbiont of Tipula unca]
MSYIAEKLAAIKGVPLVEVASRTTQNAENLFEKKACKQAYLLE